MDIRYQDAANLMELPAYAGMGLGEATSLRRREAKFDSNGFVVTGGETGTQNHEVRGVPLFPASAAFPVNLKAGTRADENSP